MFVLIFFYLNIITFQTLPQPSDSILLCNNNFHFDFNPKQKGEYSTTPSNVHDYKKQKSASDRKRKPKQTNKKQPHKKIITKQKTLNEMKQYKKTKQNIIQMQNKIKQTETKTK